MERIEIKEAVAMLRRELSDSIKASAGEELRFQIGEIVIEFQVEIERAAGIEGGLKFWVVNLGSKISEGSTKTHKITLPLKPVSTSGGPILTGSFGETPK